MRAVPQGRSEDAPPGLDPSAAVEFQVLLVSFEREGYWQNLSWEERWALADRLKDKGNALFKEKKYAYASNRWVGRPECYGGTGCVSGHFFCT